MRRALKSALLGALIGAMPWLIDYLVLANPVTGRRGWALLMLPIFALVGAITGLLLSIALSGLRTASSAASSQMHRRPINTDPLNVSEWENPRNWSAGVFYHSSVDRRILVPKRLGGLGFTLNLGHRAGRMILILMIMGALIVMLLDLRK